MNLYELSHKEVNDESLKYHIWFLHTYGHTVTLASEADRLFYMLHDKTTMRPVYSNKFEYEGESYQKFLLWITAN